MTTNSKIYVKTTRCKKCHVLVVSDVLMEIGQCVTCWRKGFESVGED